MSENQPESVRNRSDSAHGLEWAVALHEAGIPADVDDIARGLAGAALMPIAALLAGAGPTGGCIDLDFHGFARTTPGLPDRLMKLIHAGKGPASEVTWPATTILRDLPDGVKPRLRWYAAFKGDIRSAERLFIDAHRSGSALERCYTLGLMLRIRAHGDLGAWTHGCDLEILHHGMNIVLGRNQADNSHAFQIETMLKSNSAWSDVRRQRFLLAGRYTPTIPRSPREDKEALHDQMTGSGHWEPRKDREYDHLSDEWTPAQPAAETRSTEEIVPEPEDRQSRRRLVEAARRATLDAAADQDEIPDLDSVYVVDALHVVDVPSDRELAKLVEKISGRAVPLRLVPAGFDRSRPDLAAQYPHATSAIDTMIGHLKTGDIAASKPILLVGPPGTGKSTLARDAAAHLHLPCTIFPCASVSDGSFGGTPAQWQSRRVSTPLQAIVRSGVANPVVILDEIEKAGHGGHNGSLLHVLLPMLEAHTSSEYFETGIEMPANLSRVIFIATANDLSAVPGPLRDRFTVVRVPEPGLEHLETLAQNAVRQLRDAAMTEPAFMPDFAADELAVIARAWGGGSLRRLNRCLDATLAARETSLRHRPN